MVRKKKLLPARDVLARYGIVDRTADRWVESGILPDPIRINNRRYWDEEALEQREREGMRRRPHKPITDTPQPTPIVRNFK